MTDSEIRIVRIDQSIEPIKLGEVPANDRIPDELVFVDVEGGPQMRLHIFLPELEYHLKTMAVTWSHWIVIGFAHRVVLVSRDDCRQVTVSLTDDNQPQSFDYFCQIECDSKSLLVTSGRRIFRIDGDGRVLWKSKELGVDGVLIHDVGADGIIYGAGECDPPDGWVDFKVSLETGQRLEAG
jgi:hypothetical protein